MKCHGCGGYGFSHYRRGRPVPCRKCSGTGWIGERAATLARWMESHERAIARYGGAFQALADSPYRALVP